MKLFRLSRKPESGEKEKELVLDTDADAQAPVQDTTDAEGKAEASADTPTPDATPEAALVIQIGDEADSETESQESTPPSELEDIPIQDLLSDLMGVSQRLGRTPPARPEPASDEARDVGGEPASAETRDVGAEPDEELDVAEPDTSDIPQATVPPPTEYRRYALHALLLSLALAVSIGALIGAQRLARTESTQNPPIVVATVPGLAPGLDGLPETAVEPTPEASPEPTPEATPEPAPELQPAYFLYTVQPGDTISAIAGVFAISPDYVLWNNPHLVPNPNLLLVGEQLLIPSVDGIIYRVKPGDTLASIAASYQIDAETILAFAPNGLTSPDSTITGMVLILPGAVPPLLPRPSEAPTASEPQPTEPTPTPEAPTASEPQATEPTPTPETPTPSEPQPTQPPADDEYSPFSIGRIWP